STKTKVQLEVAGISDLRKRFVGTHPIAGRERSGPQAARSDLFLGRAWVLTPSEEIEAGRLELVTDFVTAMGATPYQMSTKQHDALFAKISHLPQVISIALASSISELGSEISLAGQGLRDMLRLAGSDGELWSQILSNNKEEVLSSIDDFQELLDVLRDAIADSDNSRIREMFEDAGLVLEKIGGKHGLKRREYSFVDVVIDDKPGQLAILFEECGKIKVNVEDLNLEHSPQQETGLIRLALSSSDADVLYQHLLARGWKAHKQ
ncbi:MAG: prephenate dehydrogenase/arogenate dehydrogenase family protein, partial [Candidatus Nanopelagicaceae bacterium]